MSGNKYLMVVGAGILQVPTILEANKMGLKTIVTDMNLDAPAMQLADVRVQLSTKDVEGHVREAMRLAKSMNIVGAYTQGTDVEVTVAEVAAALGLPGIPPEVARICNNKIKMRQKLSQAGVPGPRFDYSTEVQDAKRKAEALGYPLVVKSIDNSASRGVKILYDESGFEDACKEALSHSVDKQILLEEYLQGVEYSVDTVMYQGRLYPAGISDREFDLSKEFAVQTGSLTPSFLPEATQQEIYQLMEVSARAVGVENGAFKGDIILVNGKPMIIEITARLSGGFDSQYRKPYSFGINLIKATIDIAVGNKLDYRDLVPKWVKYSKTFSPFPVPGIVRKISGLETLQKQPGIRNIFMMIKEGDVVRDYKHCADRVAYIVASGDTYQQLKEREKLALGTLKIETEAASK